MLPSPADPARIKLTRDLHPIGQDARVFSTGARQGELVRLRRGAYSSTIDWEKEGALLRLRAVALTAKKPPLFSHRSAAVIWGLPFLTVGAPVAETLVARAGGGRSKRGIVRRGVDLNVVSEACVHGFRVTSIERTLIDLAKSVPFASAVMAMDFAISDRRGTKAPLTSAALVRKELDRLESTRLRSRVERVLEFADGMSESPNESLSRTRMLELGFPAPQLQVEFVHHTGIVDRVDFFWPEFGLIGECDGLAKYSDPTMRGERSAEEVVIAEKRREDRLRSQQPRFARWEWSDAYRPARLRAILEAAGLPSRGR